MESSPVLEMHLSNPDCFACLVANSIIATGAADSIDYRIWWIRSDRWYIINPANPEPKIAIIGFSLYFLIQNRNMQNKVASIILKFDGLML